MKLDLTDEDQLLSDTLERIFTDCATSVRIRAAEEGGMDRDLWAQLHEMGVPLLRVALNQGGGDGTLLHALIAAESAGRHLAPVPLIESLVGYRLLSQLGDAGGAVLQTAAAAGQVITLALADTSSYPRQIVPAGALASVVLCLDAHGVGILRDFESSVFKNHGGQPLSRIDFRSRAHYEKIGGLQFRRKFLAAMEEYKLLQAALVAAAARQSVDLAAKYATERVAFDRPIGFFQAVAHPLANAATELDGAILLNRRAAHAIAKARPNAAALVSMANVFARKAAPRGALAAMRIFGGYGMTMEYDAQLYYRRVNAWSLICGDPNLELAAAADRLWNGVAVDLPETAALGIDFDLSPEAAVAAERAAAFASIHVDAARREFIFQSLDTHQPDFNRLAAKEQLHLPDLPTEYGGAGLSGEAAFGVRDAFSEAGWEDITVIITDIVAKTVARFGSEELKREVLPAVAKGEKYCSLGYTEPSGGSDVFGAKTFATREGDMWIINGQKIFTSAGHLASYILLLARTDRDLPKHKGLTLFVVPVDQPGYEIAEIKTISEERTNTSFYENVRVPDAYRIGEVNGALRVMAKALEVEQSGGDLYTHGLRVLLEAALDWAKHAEEGCCAPLKRPEVRLTLAEIATHLEVQDVLVRRCVWSVESGMSHKAFGPMSKLFGSETWLSGAHAVMAIAAPEGLERGYTPLGIVEKQARRAIPATIYAGSSEIQRSIIAESALGLPRSR